MRNEECDFESYRACVQPLCDGWHNSGKTEIDGIRNSLELAERTTVTVCEKNETHMIVVRRQASQIFTSKTA